MIICYFIDVVNNNTEFLQSTILAGLGAFVGWVFTRSTSYLATRRKLLIQIKTEINLQIENHKDNQKWLRKFEQETLKEGGIVTGAPFYTPEKFETIKSVLVNKFFFLRSREQNLILHIVKRLSEIEVLLDGYCKSLREYQKNETQLKKNNIDSLSKRAERIHSVIDLFPKEYHSIGQMNTDFSKRLRAEHMVLGKSQTTNGAEV